MQIIDARYLENGWIALTTAEGPMTVPDDLANGDRRAVAAWEAAGGTIAPFEPPVERQLVAKSVIVDRLEQVGKLDAARAALDAAPLYDRERWNARDAIYADDATALALLAAIGADPDVILAP